VHTNTFVFNFTHHSHSLCIYTYILYRYGITRVENT
jgi:hypothetical protein